MFGIFRKEAKQRKVVVAGLDGVPYSLLVEYMARGIMPELSALCAKGSLHRMKSSLPEVSSVAWTSFMTGRNPGQHGIFGFMEIDRNSYEYRFPNFSTLKEKPFWEDHGLKTVAFNIPQTYPARPMNGVLVSGFVAIDIDKATYPDRVLKYLKSIDYQLDVNARLALQSPDAFFDNMFHAFRKRTEAMEHLYDSEDWSLFIGTITETDRLHHFFFDSALEGTHYPVFEKFYRELDRFIGRMAGKAAKEESLFLTCSDHGFTPITSEVYLNRWLVEQGYLGLNGKEDLTAVDGATRAFCLDPSRIYVHSKGKYARGSVSSEQHDTLVKEIKEKLLSLRYNDQPIVKAVYNKADIFHGDYEADGPDMYILPEYGFDLKGALNKKNLFGTTHFRGMHTYDDAHFLISEKREFQDISIQDIADVILKYLRQ